jgi:hypothetical protein
MHKEIRVVDEAKNIVRITTVDERWYSMPGTNEVTGLPEFKFLPSSTWIADSYPKGIGFYKWLAEKGWDEAKALKESAGTRGTKVHRALDYLEENGVFPIDTILEGEPMATDELECIMSFAAWHEKEQPQLLAKEMTVFGDDYAGTLDRIYRIDGRVWVVDFKTSQYIWESMKLQISSYSHAHIDIKALGITEDEWASRGLAVLQVGYRMNKNRYKFTEIEDKYELFKVARIIWENENKNASVQEKDFPLIIKLKKEQDNGTVKRPSKKEQQLDNVTGGGECSSEVPGLQNHPV